MRTARLLALALAVATCAFAVAALCGGAQAHPPPEATLEAELAAHTVDEDISALREYRMLAKEAGVRLVRRGEAILAQLHAALAAAEGNDKQREQLITVLAEIGQPESAGPILAAALAHPDEPAVTKAALQLLPYLTAEPVGSELAERTLRDPAAHVYLKRQALAYLGSIRDPRARNWSAAYRSSPEVNLRVAAIWAAARLGDATAGADALRELSTSAPESLRHELLLSAAEVVGPEELGRALPEALRQTPEFRSAVLYSRLRTAPDATRREAAREMLSGPFSHEKAVAGDYLVQLLGADEFVREFGDRGVATTEGAAARRALRRAGFRVVENGLALEVKGRLR